MTIPGKGAVIVCLAREPSLFAVSGQSEARQILLFWKSNFCDFSPTPTYFDGS